MRVWQPGGHLTMQRGADVRDWSWRATLRRIRFLARDALTRAHLADRLEANGSGRWVSHLSGARGTRRPRRGSTEVRP